MRPIHWWTSPACSRVLERLECHGEATAPELAAAVHISHGYTRTQVMPLLVSECLVRVVGWVRNHSGQARAIYALGPGPSVPRPGEVDNALRMRRRRRQMAKAYGTQDANKVLQHKGAVVRDGRRLSTAGFARTAGEVVR